MLVTGLVEFMPAYGKAMKTAKTMNNSKLRYVLHGYRKGAQKVLLTYSGEHEWVK